MEFNIPGTESIEINTIVLDLNGTVTVGGRIVRGLKLDCSTCASIGNGLIDVKAIERVRLGVVTMQSEGVHVQTLRAADIGVPSVINVLDLFIHERSLIATLRK